MAATARLYATGRDPGPVLEAGCFAHARRKFFELADVERPARRRAAASTLLPWEWRKETAVLSQAA